MSDAGCRNPARLPGGLRKGGKDREAISYDIEWRQAQWHSVFGTASATKGIINHFGSEPQVRYAVKHNNHQPHDLGIVHKDTTYAGSGAMGTYEYGADKILIMKNPAAMAGLSHE